MKHLMVVAHVVQKFSGDAEVKAWVEMPMGAKPFKVSPYDNGNAIAIWALGDPKALTLQYPLMIFPIGAAMEVPLNEGVGDFIGDVVLTGGMACIFKGADWPTNALAPAGHA